MRRKNLAKILCTKILIVLSYCRNKIGRFIDYLINRGVIVLTKISDIVYQKTKGIGKALGFTLGKAKFRYILLYCLEEEHEHIDREEGNVKRVIISSLELLYMKKFENLVIIKVILFLCSSPKKLLAGQYLSTKFSKKSLRQKNYIFGSIIPKVLSSCLTLLISWQFLERFNIPPIHIYSLVQRFLQLCRYCFLFRNSMVHR